jgi:hypothetical protein
VRTDAQRQKRMLDYRQYVQRMHISPEQPPRNPHSRGPAADRRTYIYEPG